MDKYRRKMGGDRPQEAHLEIERAPVIPNEFRGDLKVAARKSSNILVINVLLLTSTFHLLLAGVPNTSNAIMQLRKDWFRYDMAWTEEDRVLLLAVLRTFLNGYMPASLPTLVPVEMAQSNIRTTPILPPSTPLNPNARPPPSQQPMSSQPRDKMTPTSDSRMNPPTIPRSLVTPSRDMRETSVMSSASSVRKPRQNLDERDHILMLKHCYAQRHNFKEGNKTQFWTAVNTLFQQDTGKVLAQMSATVGRLVESRRRQVADWDNGVIPQKPGGELNDSLDQWIEFLKLEDGEGEAERMRQVEVRRRMEESRKEARRQALAAEATGAPQITTARMVSSSQPEAVEGVTLPQHHVAGRELVQANGESEMNGYRPNKRKRRDERSMAHEPQAQAEENPWQGQQLPQQHYTLLPPPEPTRRVVVEGALTKEDWRDIMGNDARLRALESKIDRIELLVSQNNKLLLQLIQSQSKDRDRDMDRNNDEDRVPVHLDAEFERDYL